MDETAWLACTDPERMLAFLRGTATERKLRLFACACCWRIWPALVQAGSRQAVETSQRYADGQATADDLLQASVQAQLAWRRVRYPDDPEYAVAGPLPGPDPGSWIDGADAAAALVERPITGAYDRENAWHAARAAAEAARRATGEVGAEARAQAALLRDLFGNPFRSVALDASCRSPAVLALAQAVYESLALPGGTLEPDRLAVLADALEEAGCTDAEILGHLRGPGPHVCGCHVLDAIIGKKEESPPARE